MRPLLAVLLLAVLTPAAPVPKGMKAKKDDAVLIVGTWSGSIQNGQPPPADSCVFTFDADGNVNLKSGPGNGSEWTWTLDPTETPKRMRWVHRTDPANIWKCVYELSGDTLKIGFVHAGTPIPTSFAPAPGVTLYELTRDTPGK